MKLGFVVLATFLANISFNGVALAQTKVTLTEKDPQGLFWDAGTSQWGGSSLQVFQAFVPNEPSQAFTWNPVTNGWTICSLSICLSDNGQEVEMGTHADVWNITSQYAVQNLRTGNYIEQPSNPQDGSFLSTGSTPFTWAFAVVNGGSSGGSGRSGASQTNIMPLGDSITEGYASLSTVIQGGYRCPLYSSLTGSGVNFTFVGDSASLEAGVVTTCPDVNWEGHGGYDIASIQGFEDSDGSVRSDKPNIILLLAGTNDVAEGGVYSISARLSGLLNDLFLQDPGTWVIISTIPPMNPYASAAPSGVASWASQVPTANAQIRLAAAQYPRTTLIDFYSAAVKNVNANIGTDGVHPTVTGYGILAKLWQTAIAAYLR